MSRKISRIAFVVTCFLEVLCQFSGGILHLVRFSTVRRNATKTDARGLGGRKMYIKSFKRRAWGLLGAGRSVPGPLKSERGGCFLEALGAPWCILGAILAPAGF